MEKEKLCKCGHTEEEHQECYIPAPYGCRECYCRKFEENSKGCGKITNEFYTYKDDKIVCGYKFPDGSISYCDKCKEEAER